MDLWVNSLPSLTSRWIWQKIYLFSPGLINAALQSEGATCSTNNAGFKPIGCYGAIDGSIIGSNANDVWMFYGISVGTWIEVVFNAPYLISELKFMQPYWEDEKNFKSVVITFSDGSNITVCLNHVLLFISRPTSKFEQFAFRLPGPGQMATTGSRLCWILQFLLAESSSQSPSPIILAAILLDLWSCKH